jgi:hypothetical protein
MPRQAAQRALSTDWFERAVRIGHAAKAVVFGGLGFLAARVAFGEHDETPDFPGTLEALAGSPLNVLFLGLLALGLLAYAGWRLIYAVAGPAEAGNGVRGWAARAIMLGVGVTYAGFGVYALGLLFGLRRENDGIDDETAGILALPFGTWIVGAIAAGVVIAGLHELFVAFSARFREEFAHARLRRWERGLVLVVGWWGHAARGAIYCVAGYFGVKAAAEYDASEARGFADTLWAIAAQPYGAVALLFVAAGLGAFGLYAALLALHRHVPDASGRPEERVP